MATAGIAASDNDAGRSSETSILSSKVSRALEVRTDTPAMKAALDALAHLPDHQDDLFSVDSRSVRVAIEQDALQQALQLEDELRKLLSTVSQLRQSVAETAAISQRAKEAIHTNVIMSSTSTDGPTSTASSLGQKNTPEKAEDAIEKGSGTASAPSSGHSGILPTVAEDALEQEQKLAALLSESFVQRNLARKRLDAVHAFLEKFDLPSEKSRLLDHYAFEDIEASSSPVNGMAFLDALDRVRLIRHELGRTFGTLDFLHSQQQNDTNDSRLGASSALRMMEMLSQKQERAFERLYHWLQKYLQLHAHVPTGSSNNHPVIPNNEDLLDEALSHPFVRRSLCTLKNVPAFYSHVLELIAASRRAEETRRFLLALTSGYSGLPPIEMKAHDSVAYVGDMLAFCFRAFSIEADVAKGLFNNQLEGGGGGTTTTTTEVEEKEEQTEQDEPEFFLDKPMSAAELVAQSMSGVSRPLRSRILQVVGSLSRRPDDEEDDDDDGMNDSIEEEGALARTRISQLYEICGLLLFYASAIETAVVKLQKDQPSQGTRELEKNPIVICMVECLGEASNAYEASLRVYSAMLEQLNLLTGDSEANMSHAMIVRIVKVRQASPGFAEDVECPSDYQHILSLDWACEVLVEAALPTCKSLDDVVALKHSISVARSADMKVETSSKLTEEIKAKETSLIDVLVEKETTDALDLCGLGSLNAAWKLFQGVQVDGMVMASHPGLSREDVESAIKEFYSSLYSPPLPSFESTIKDPTLRKLARTKIADNVCATYEELYNAMTKPDRGGYDDLSFLGHTPSQVKSLFSV